MVTYIALTLGLLLALLIGLLAVPLSVAFSIHRIGETTGFVRFWWLFGLVRYQLCFPRDAKPKTQGASPPKKKAKPAGKKGGAGRALTLIRQQGFRRRVVKFVRDMLRATHGRDLFLRLRIGLGDPADTGCLWAVVGPVAGLAQTLQSIVVRIEPEFMDPVFEVESHGQFRLVPIQFFALSAAFLLSPTMLGAWRQLRRGR